MTREATVLLFARVREAAQADRLVVTVPDAATARDLRLELARLVPQARDLIEKCAIAINGEYAQDDAAIPMDAEIALIPPVSGG